MKVQEILDFLSPSKFIGDPNTEIVGIVPFDKDNISENMLMWINDKNLPNLEILNAGTIICSQPPLEIRINCNYIIVENPRLSFKDVLEKFFVVAKKENVISTNSNIDPSVKFGKNVGIASGVQIESGCIIGDNSTIDSNTVLKSNTIIGSNVTIGCNNTIGGVGFGYEKDLDGSYIVIPHIGNVVIKDYVEIGNNTCIDRAVMGSTIIEDNAKIDNLVHIAHGAVIGKNSLIIANAMVAGSCIIGENVWVAPSSSILNKIKIEDNATIGMGAVVLKNVEQGSIIIGNPGKKLIKNEQN